MPGCEIRIAGDGEILVRSEMMFSGYYKEPEKTVEVMSDGWLLTGDLGETDADGFLKITERKKELIVLSTGKNVAPSLIENMIKEHHLVSQAFVYGEGRSYLVALITLNAAETAEHVRPHDRGARQSRGLSATSAWPRWLGRSSSGLTAASLRASRSNASSCPRATSRPSASR